MIDQKKVNEYITAMMLNINGLFQVLDTTLKQSFTRQHECISEKALHEFFEFGIANEKMAIEANQLITKEHKEAQKALCEFCLKFLEEQIKISLKQQNRLT